MAIQHKTNCGQLVGTAHKMKLRACLLGGADIGTKTIYCNNIVVSDTIDFTKDRLLDNDKISEYFPRMYHD